MANDGRTQDQANEDPTERGAPSDPDALVTTLERSLREEPRPSPQAEADIRARLSRLYLVELRDPLSAAVHVEALLEGPTVERAVLESAAALLEHRPIAARIAEKLAGAYARLGEVASEIGVLTKELSIARPPRLEQAKRRLADLHFEHLDDAEGALDLLEPVLQRNAADDSLRVRYVEIALASDNGARAIRALMRATRTEKDPAARTRLSRDLGELYLKQGELRRARKAFFEALGQGSSDPSAVSAAKRLLVLEPEPGDPTVIGAALETIARFDTDPASRHSAAERLLLLPETAADDDRSIAAWRALVDSSKGAEALDRLSELFEKKNDAVGLIEVLRAKAPSRETYARLIPLLEKAGLWKDLSEVLERQADLVPPAEAAAILGRLGRTRMSRLGDTEAAIVAFRKSLALDPKNLVSRSSLEKLLGEGAHRHAAADALEAVYRAEGYAEGLARVLTTRAELSASPSDKLSALGKAFEAAEAAGAPGSTLMALAESALREAARHAPELVTVWLSHHRELAARDVDRARDGAAYTRALRGIAVNRPELAELAGAAIDALVESGDGDAARALCETALASCPASTELLERFDRLAGPEASPRERLSRYENALARTTDAAARQRIMRIMAEISRRDLDDLPRAIDLWQRILKDTPTDIDALLGLLSAYERLENRDALLAEIDHALETFDGEARQTILLRKAAALSKFGERSRSSEVRDRLLDEPRLRNSVVEAILTAAYEDDQPDVYRKALEIQANAEDPAVRVLALERLGDFHFERLGDRRAAIDSWKPAARLYTTESAEESHARELYERVLEASPDDREASWRLVELYAKSGDWARVPEVFGALLRSDGGLEPAIARLLGLERDAARAGAVDEYVSMVDETIPRLGTQARESRYRLLQAKARILSTDPARQSEASAAHRQVIEAFGSELDIEAFETFIESRGSADDRQSDLRWLFEFRARRSPDATDCLLEWAKSEEEYGDLEGAIRVYERLVEIHPGRQDALEALARLTKASGNFEACLAALRSLREVAAPDRAEHYDVAIARLLANDLGRRADALRTVAPRFGQPVRSSELLELARRALRSPESRASAIEILERASEGAAPEVAAANLELLIDETSGEPNVSKFSRCFWYARLIDFRSNDAEAALELAERGVKELVNAAPLWDALERFARLSDGADRAAEAYRRAVESGLTPELARVVGKRIIDLLDDASPESEEVHRTLACILEHAPDARWALDRVKLILSAQSRWDELFALYDRAIAGAANDRARADLLAEAAFAARDLGRSEERAISYFERLLALRPGDASAEAALERLYERAGMTAELIRLLSARVDGTAGIARLELLHRIASFWLDLGASAEAVDVVDSMRKRGASVDDVKDVLERIVQSVEDAGRNSGVTMGAFERAVELLSAHYAAAGLTADLIRLTRATLSFSDDPAQRARCAKDLVRLRLEAAYDADDAFSVTRAALQTDLGGDAALREVAAERLLEEAVADWVRRGRSADSDAARTALASIGDLCELKIAAGRVDGAVAVLTSALDLSFHRASKRELRSKLAFVLADRKHDVEGAIAAFRALFDEDARDRHAEAAAQRFSELLDEAGLDRERAELWDRIGATRVPTDPRAAREALRLAAALWEEQGDAERAILSYTAEAALGSETALVALARLYGDGGRWREAAQTLERLYRDAKGDDRTRLGLAAAAAHVNAGDAERAKERLSELVRLEPRARDPRKRLLALHRESGAWTALAGALVDGAAVAEGRDERLALLKEAVLVYLRRLKDPMSAVPLAKAALEMDPESTEIRLELGDALDQAGHHDEAVDVLRGGLVGSDKRSKYAGALHRLLGRALLHANRRSEALVELGAAAKSNPTEPNTLYELSLAAADAGDLDLAERTLRAVLLALPHHTDASWEGPNRAEVYLDLSRVVESRGDATLAKELVESAFDSSLETEDEALRLEQALEQRGRHDLLALALERRLRSAPDLAKRASALESLVALWEGALGRPDALRAVLSRHTDAASRDADDASTVDPAIWRALERANAAIGGEGARTEAVKKHILALTRAAERATGEAAAKLTLEAATLRANVSGELGPAISAVEALLEKNPEDASAWTTLSDLCGRTGDRERLVAAGEAALAALPASPWRQRLRLEVATLALSNPSKVGDAVETLNRFLADDPGNTEALDLLSGILERAGRYEELAALLSQRLGSVDEAHRRAVTLRLARALEHTSRAGEAADLYASLVTDPNATLEDLRALAERLGALGSDRLVDCLERLGALETGKDAARHAKRLAELRSASGDVPGTLRALEMGFAADRGDRYFRDRLVKAYEEGGRWDRLAAVLGEALARDRGNRALLQRLVDAHQRNGDPERALVALNAALADGGPDADLLRMRAWVHEAAGRFEDALSDLERAYAVDPGLADDLIALLAQVSAREAGNESRRSLELFDLLVAQDRMAEARSTLESLLERCPRAVAALERLASLSAAEGDWAGARAACQRLLPLLGADPAAVARVSLVLADACEGKGSLAEATGALEQALEVVPESAEIRRRLSKAYEAAGEHAKLEKLLVAEVSPANGAAENAALLLRAAELALESGGHERARGLAERARDLDPTNAEALLVIARSSRSLGRADEAETTLREVLKTAKGRAPALVSSAHFELGELQLSRDEIFEAFDSLKQSFNADPKNDRAAFVLALVALDLDDERTAGRCLAAVTSARSALPPASKATAFYHQARIARNKGDLRRAKQLAMSALNENAEDREARALLDSL